MLFTVTVIATANVVEKNARRKQFTRSSKCRLYTLAACHQPSIDYCTPFYKFARLLLLPALTPLLVLSTLETFSLSKFYYPFNANELRCVPVVFICKRVSSVGRLKYKGSSGHRIIMRVMCDGMSKCDT